MTIGRQAQSQCPTRVTVVVKPRDQCVPVCGTDDGSTEYVRASLPVIDARDVRPLLHQRKDAGPSAILTSGTLPPPAPRSSRRLSESRRSKRHEQDHEGYTPHAARDGSGWLTQVEGADSRHVPGLPGSHARPSYAELAPAEATASPGFTAMPHVLIEPRDRLHEKRREDLEPLAEELRERGFEVDFVAREEKAGTYGSYSPRSFASCSTTGRDMSLMPWWGRSSCGSRSESGRGGWGERVGVDRH